jgi:Cu-Zn family superoxide dismutase
MRNTVLTATLLVSLGLASCGSPDTGEDQVDTENIEAVPETETQRQAVAMLQMVDGTGAGTATATSDGDSLAIALNVSGLKPGEHGVHVHTIGDCSASDFSSAGDHWNPTERAHGLDDPAGQHAGDMPNLTVAADGTGSLDYTLVGATFDGLLDEDGSAFVIHADRDDQVTDPSGNSGNRIACGVFAEG